MSLICSTVAWCSKVKPLALEKNTATAYSKPNNSKYVFEENVNISKKNKTKKARLA